MMTETQVGWQDYLAIILRRRWYFLAPCLAIALGTLIFGLFLPKYYKAETILMVQEQNVMNPLIQGLAVSTPVGERLRTLREELLSWTSLSRLVTELKLDQQAKSPVAFERMIKRLQKDIRVRMRGRNLIAIAYEEQDPKLAQTLVNTVTNIYMDRNIESQTAEAETAISFIESEMAVYKKKLEDSERALREFKELYVMRMPVATQLNKDIIGLEVALAQMLVENTDEHPTVIQTRRRIGELKKKRNDEIRKVIATAMAKGHDPEFYQGMAQALEQPSAPSADPVIQAAKDAYSSWVNRLDAPDGTPQAGGAAQPVQVIATPGEDGKSLEILSSDATSLTLGPREQQELSRLTRDYQVHSSTYRHMQQRLERAKVTQRLGESDEGTKFKVLEPARLPLKPVRPNLMRMFLMSLVMGMFVGAGAAFVAEYLDQSFQSTEELEAALGLPVIGSISTIVTESDMAAKRQRRKHWISLQQNLQRFRTYVIQPVWSRLDRALLRWGL